MILHEMRRWAPKALPLTAFFFLLAAAQKPPDSPATAPPAPSCDVTGRVTSGNQPLPGVAVTAAHTLTGKKVATSTDIDGSYLFSVPSNGRYVVRAELSAFAPLTREVLINAANCHPRADLEMTLLSRVPATQPREAQQQPGEQLASALNGAVQSLQLSGDGGMPGGAVENGLPGGAPQSSDMTGMPQAGLNPDAPTESLAVAGASGQTNDFMFGGNNEEMRQRIEEIRERARRGELGPGDAIQIMGGPGGGPGPGGPGLGGGPGVGGGPGMGGGQVMVLGGRGGRFNINKPHGALFYSVDDSTFDAKPYSLTGAATPKADYRQQRFGATLGGPLKIPHIYDGGTKTFFFLNYFGNRAENPYDVFSTVPTLAERNGDFSQTRVRSGPHAGLPVQIFDPATGQPFANNQIPSNLINPAAAGLLNFIPLPNLPGDAQNFHFVTQGESNNDNFSLRLIHNFGAAGAGPFMTGGAGGGGRGGGRRGRNNLNVGLNWRRSNSVINNPFPSVQGRTSARGWNALLGYVRSKGRLVNNFHFNYNANHLSTRNLYSGVQNLEGSLGIGGVASDPFAWGLPGLSFTNYSGMSDIAPQRRDDQTFSLSDGMSFRKGKHNLRWGGDFRRLLTDLRADKNGRGSFIFTGLYTAQLVNGTPVSGSGLDFADFLLGLAQQASVQYGANLYRFRSNSWDLYVQDDWRLRGNLTVNVGLRYEYVSPFRELDNRMVNLDIAPGFIAVAPALPDQAGPYTGTFPVALIDPDRNNFAPRVGIAWKPLPKTVVRAGYGINYNTTAYNAMAQNLAFQPPFAFTQTNLGALSSPLPLQDAFPTVVPDTTTNSYGVNRDYRIGYVQLWNLDVQQEVGRSLVVNLGYNGSKGTRLDIVRAPNRGPDGLRIPGVQPFLFEDSLGDSILHAGTIRVRKRLQHGLSVGGTYTFSKSLDNASTIGGGAVVVAQNDQDLAAERGLSSFDQRHRFSADYFFEPPFGANRRWFAGKGWGSRLLGGWQWSGNLAIASGTPFTPRVLGNFADIARGTSGTLRADYTGQPITLDDPTVAQWFNTVAFVVPPAGQFGNARRNSIPGPTTVNFNMSLGKVVQLADTKMWEFRIAANNVFNTPQYVGLDSVVNSRTFGQVISAGPTRRVTLSTRFRF